MASTWARRSSRSRVRLSVIPLGLVDEAVELLDDPEADALGRPDLFVERVERMRGRRAHQPVDAAIDGVALALPGRAHATWLAVVLE